VTVRKSN